MWDGRSPVPVAGTTNNEHADRMKKVVSILILCATLNAPNCLV